MTSLTFSDILHNSMHFNTRDGQLYRTAVRFSILFHKHSIRYYILGGYALIFHGMVRNTMDIDIIVHEDDFQKATQILYDIEYTKQIGDGLCARFQHSHFLSIDILVSPIYGPHPSKINTVEYEQHIIFCNLPILMCTKIKAFIGRPITETMAVKQMQDHVDLCSLIIIHKLKKEYAKDNNFDYAAQCAYERIYRDYYNKFNLSNSKKKQKCICQ